MALVAWVYKKGIIRAFKSFGFKIEISSNIKIANFPDVILNLSDSTYKPFLKTDQLLATIVEGDPKAPFSIATTPRCRGGRYSFP